ncbi:MAG TPA: hypothetical protein DSN98_08325 [Thermoplasmata archaeon]|jgi:5'-deoxynucleotidase YfbR-like HD superfamily hydrolase|nr:MAG TPA: hypothetical protein DSN98_08325 [Thermoplasmata archaeon]
MTIKDYIEKNRTMRAIKRFNMEAVIHPQSLSCHGYGVGTLFYLLCTTKGVEITAEDLFMIMNHDFAETFTGDLNKQIKNHSIKTITAWEQIEREILPSHLFPLSDEGLSMSLTNETYPLFLFSDAMEAWLYTSEEISKGNTCLVNAHAHYRNLLCKMILEFEKEKFFLQDKEEDKRQNWVMFLDYMKGEVGDGL